jgi:hypothetical protein
LAGLELDSRIPLSLVYRGAAENAARFIEAQDALIAELYTERKRPKKIWKVRQPIPTNPRKARRRSAMNFKKKSIFERGGGEEQEQEVQSSGGILAVWGSPSSGKTVTAVKLAKDPRGKKT